MGFFILIRTDKNGYVLNVWYDEDTEKLMDLKRYLEINDGDGNIYSIVDVQHMPDMNNKSI